MMKSLMIQGTASGVGKSILSIGICRMLQRKNCIVAPFKSQNMSSNTYRLNSGLEMAKTQAIAAWACEIEPHVDMNPILLKPTGNTMEVIVQGRSLGRMCRNDYEEYKRHDAWNSVMDSYKRLAGEYNIIVLEGAGSPVEMNMKESDMANMNMALRIGAPVILVADIDRGGVFAGVMGTLSLLSDMERRAVQGIIINKCRGQADRFAEVRDCMERIAGIPVLGMVPYLDVDIEDEDSLTDGKTGPKAEHPYLTHAQRRRQFDALAESLEAYLDWPRISAMIERGN